MTFATVMASLALDQPNKACLEVAGELAERFGAVAIGVAAAHFAPPLYFADGEQAQALIEQGEAAIRHKLGGLEAEFRAAVGGRAAALDWRAGLDFPVRHALAQARAADIIVSGGSRTAFSDAFAQASPRDLVVQAGRPLLVVPDTARWLDLRYALVAWKDAAEARRAAADALPLLREAKEVIVAEILEDDDGRAAAEARVTDVVAWLARHGVIASRRAAGIGEASSVAAVLDAIAEDIGAQLIVAGAYGHSRFRELVLGGVTQHLLTQTDRCVLLSR
jgi:nucleotide-binding universal stress UspA family protein